MSSPEIQKPITLDPMESARAAHLRYVDDTGPGLRRIRSGKGFRYLDHQRKSLRDAEHLERIRHLAIPPAWTDVWICPRADGHIQATGRDARGRKQYRYHPRFRPAVFQAYFDGHLVAALARRAEVVERGSGHRLSADEEAVLGLIRAQAALPRAA